MLRYFRWIAQYYRPHRLHMALLFVLTLVSSSVALALPLVLRSILDNLQQVLAPENGGQFNRLLLMLGAIGLAALVADFYPGARAWLNCKIGLAVRDRVFDSILRKDYRFFNRFRPGDLATRLTDDISEYPRIGWFSCSAIFRALEASSRLVFCLAVMFWMCWQLTLLALIPLPLMLWIFYRVEYRLGRRIEESRRATSRTGELLDSTFAGMAIIKAYRAEKGQSARLRRLLDTRLEIDLSITKLVMVVESLYTMIGQVGKVLVLLVGGIFVIKGRIGIGDLYAFYVYLDMILAPMHDIPNLFVTSKQAFASIDREQEIFDFPEPPQRDGGASAGPARKIEFEKAGFLYPESSNGVRGITATISAPCIVAVVGEVGSGKTTLLKMLAGLLPCVEGEIRLNGVPISGIAPDVLSRETGYVPQDSMLFSESIADNVDLGRGIGDEGIEKALRLADLPPDELPGGVSTKLGQSGCGLSGGQKQRVAIARALASGPSLCLLDDCTASLDADLEERFWKGFNAGEAGGLTFVVTHREATVRQSDLVMFLHRGELKDVGTHAELLTRQKLYRKVLASEMKK
jgi:ATP-binding cassette subfamily B protein